MSHARDLTSDDSDRTAAGLRGDVALVGRDDELDAVATLIELVRSGSGQLVLVSGEAGIGKTALVRELAARAEGAGFMVLRGHCYDLTLTPPYGPWREALGSALTGGEVAAEAVATGQTGPFDDFERVIRVVSGERALLVVLEDVHWSDDASLTLLRHVSHRIERAPIMVVATYRDDAIGPESLLFRLLPRLVREAPAVRFELRRLASDDLRDLVHARYRLPPAEEQRLIDLLSSYTNGIPLFVEELLRTFERDAKLARDGAGWRYRAVPDEGGSLPVPELLRQILEGRLASLDDGERESLRAAAVIGEEIPFELWQEALDIPNDEAASVVERALRQRILEEPPGGGPLRFRHALVRAALYNELIPPHRRDWHRRVADTLLERPEPDPDTVSHHLQQAGDARAAEWLVRAAERAARSYAPLAAMERLEAAVETLRAWEAQSNNLGWYYLRLGALGREDVALEITDGYLNQALEVAQESGDRELEVNVIWARGTNRSYQGVNGLSYMQRALDLSRDVDTAARSREPLRLMQGEVISPGVFAVWCALFGEVERAFAAADEQLSGTRSDTFQQRFGDAFAHAGRAYASALLGRPDDARRGFHALQEEFAALGHPWAQGVHAFGELVTVAVPYYTDDVQYRQWLARQIEERWGDHAASSTSLPPRYGLVAELLLQGNWDEVRDVASHLDATSVYEFYGLYALGVVARLQGQPELAWRQVHLGLPAGPGAPVGVTIRFEGMLLQELAAELALDGQDLNLARSWLAAHERWLGDEGEATGLHIWRSQNHLLRARLLRRSGDATGARVEAQRALELASTPRQPLALLRARRVLGRIEGDAGDIETARRHLIESARLAAACDSPHEMAQTWLEQARIEAVAAEHDAARVLLDMAREVIDLMDLALLRPEHERVAQRISGAPKRQAATVPLTSRELEVLGHVVAGLSNREIADLLSLSVRTVERHISNIYNKTGVQGRAAITVYALRHELVRSPDGP